MAALGVVVIGRNEGERLTRCLASITACRCPVVYVDSGSTDGSVSNARSLKVTCVDLDMSQPFSAARARNEGFRRLLQEAPDVRYVQFVDGDCELRAEWPSRAMAALEADPQLAAVCGRLRERHPETSLYNRLCDFEWAAPAGEVKACGGIALFRASCFQEAGGFDPTVTAGEEPELCLRLRRKGWRIMRLAEEMAWHDVAMTRLGQWWKRAVRGGYGGLDVATRFERGDDGVFAALARSSRLWGLGWPALVIGASGMGALAGGWAGAMIGAGAAALALPLQMARLTLRTKRQGAAWDAALAYGVLTMIAKWANLVGQWQYWQDRRAGRRARLIEHKAPTMNTVTNP